MLPSRHFTQSPYLKWPPCRLQCSAGINEDLLGQKVLSKRRRHFLWRMVDIYLPIYIEVKILANTNQWQEDPRPLAAPCWGGDCLSNLSILPSPGVHLSKSVHMDTRGGKVRPGPGLSLQGGEDTQRYWLKVSSDIDCSVVLFSDI